VFKQKTTSINRKNTEAWLQLRVIGGAIPVRVSRHL